MTDPVGEVTWFGAISCLCSAAHKHGSQKDKQESQCDWSQGCLLPALFLIYLPLLCQAPLQVSNPCLTGNQLRLQLLPCLTDRAQSQSKSQPRAYVCINSLYCLILNFKWQMFDFFFFVWGRNFRPCLLQCWLWPTDEWYFSVGKGDSEKILEFI